MKTKTKSETTTISGEIQTIRFRNSEGWAVFSIKGDSMPCTGTLAEMVDVGTEVTCTGKIENSKFGRQLKCETIVPAAPDVSTDEGVVKLLTRLPGIGPKKAMEAVQKHGHDKAWKLATIDPAQIGVKPSQVEQAKEIAATLVESYEVTVYLLGIGLTDHQAAIIYREYGNNAIEIVSTNPYQLTEIDGFGFITVDKIALKAGVSVGNPSRIMACVLYVINDSALNGGHIYHSGWNLSEIVLETLTATAVRAEVPMIGAPTIEDVRQQIHNLAAEDKVSVQKGKVYSKSLLRAEEKILGFIGGRV